MYMSMYMYTYTNTNMFYIVIVFFHIFSKCIPNGNTHTPRYHVIVLYFVMHAHKRYVYIDI